MTPYLLSLAAGILVGLIYSLLGVHSPAPPAIALVGLLGIFVGEQAPPYVKQYFHHPPTVAATSGSLEQDASKAQENVSIGTAHALGKSAARTGDISHRR